MIIAMARQALRWVPDGAADWIVHRLAERPTPLSVRPAQQDAMRQATRLRYGAGGEKAAWSLGTGPLVVFVHGWGGRAAQMAPLALHVARLGFRSVIFDMTAHGDTPGRRARWSYFIDDIAALSQSLGEDVHGYVGHSAGGLSMMAARGLKGIHARRYVCICAPSHPFPPVEVIRARLDPGEGVLERYRSYIAGQFGTTWDALHGGLAYAGAGGDLLLHYDEADRFVPHREGDRINALCPGSRLVKTACYGHTKILAAPELYRSIGEFLTTASAPHGRMDAAVPAT